MLDEQKDKDNVFSFHRRNKTGNKTCRNHCTFYNDEEESCIFFKGLDYDDPSIANQCMEFTDYHEISKLYQEEQEDTYEEDDSLLENDLVALIERTDESPLYPNQPNHNYAAVIDGLEWYVAPDKSFGCWINNQAKRPIPVYSYYQHPPIKEEKYRSLYPLHNHHAPDNLVSRMVWNIDENGYGQYSLIIGDQIFNIN